VARAESDVFPPCPATRTTRTASQAASPYRADQDEDEAYEFFASPLFIKNTVGRR
jgi:hypothetical protein